MNNNDTSTENHTERPPAIQQVETAEHLEIEGYDLRQALSNEQLSKNPHRDPERLRELWTEHETVSGVADALDAAPSTVSKWLATFGIRPRTPGPYPKHVLDAIQAAQDGESA